MEFCEGGKVDDLVFMKNYNILFDEVSENCLILVCFNMVDVMIFIFVLVFFENLMIIYSIMIIKN